MVEIFPSITTTEKGGWRRQIDEIERLGIEAICLLPTCLERGERDELYAALRRTPVTRIPLVHLRHDMVAEELRFFLEHYKTDFFNLHPRSRGQVPPFDMREFRGRILVETAGAALTGEELLESAGACPDFSHLEADRRRGSPWYDINMGFIARFPCPAGHISAIKEKPVFHQVSREFACDWHFFKDPSEFDYMRNYRRYLPPILALELENPLKDQLAVKKYLEKLLGL